MILDTYLVCAYNTMWTIPCKTCVVVVVSLGPKLWNLVDFLDGHDTGQGGTIDFLE